MCKFYNIPGMLKVFLCGISVMFFMNQADAQIKIGTNGSIIAPSSILELESANQGLLLPRLADTVGINALSPPNGTIIYLTKAPAVGLYVRKVTGWEYLTGSLGGNGNFNSLTVANSVTAGSFSGPLNGNASSATLATTATNALNSAITNDITTPAVAYPTFVMATPGNAPLRTSNTNLSFFPQTGILTATGFKGPLVGNVTGNATSSVDAQNTVNVRVTDDLTTATTVYPIFTTGTSGPLPTRASSARLGFIPLTGELTAPIFRGDLFGNSTSATTVTGNVAAVNGGTGQSVYTAGDILYAGTSNRLDKLPIGVPGTVLRVNSSFLPVWSTAGAGTVTDVNGTVNRIKVTNNTVAPVVDIDANYVGQTSITTVGPLSSGSLAAGFTAINVGQGGTGRNTLTSNAILYGNGTGNVGQLSGAAGLVLTSNGPSLPPSFEAPGIGDMVLLADQVVTGEKIFNDEKLRLNGSVSGVTTLIANSNSSGTVTLPASGTIVNRDAIETLTNKTLFSPTLTGTPNLGSATGTSLNISGNVTASSFTGPLTGNVTGNISGSSASFTGNLAGNVTGPQGATVVASVGGVNASDVATGATLANTATATNTSNAVVQRDGVGNFVASTITASLNGNASTATALATGRTISITGDLAYTSPSFNGTSNITAAGTLATVNANVGAFGSSTAIPTITVNAKGLVTAVSTNTVVAPANSLTGTTLSSSIVTSSLESVGTISSGVWNGTIIPPAYGGTGVNNSTNTFTMAGNVTHAGAFAQTFTATGITSVTLPTSGILATLAGTENLTNKTINGNTISSGTGTLTLGTGSSLITSATNPITLNSTGSTNVTLPTTGTLATLAGTESLTNKKLGSLTTNGLVKTSSGDGTLSIAAAGTDYQAPLSGTGLVSFSGSTASYNTTSASISGILSDETGSGALVFGNTPSLTTPNISAIRGSSTSPASVAVAGDVTATTATGSNLAGVIEIQSDGTGTGSAQLITVTYSGVLTFPTGSYPVLYPANAEAAGLTGPNQVFANGTTTTFTITSGPTALPAATYRWNYHVIGN